MDSYAEFLNHKSGIGEWDGFTPGFMPDFLFPFQKSLVEWAVRKGRAAIFADCGLGKTPIQLVWAENVVRETNGRVLILTPLAVSSQTVKEADKFSIEASRGQGRITVTNYEQLHKFDPLSFSGIVCDESSILKNFDGVRRSEITHFMKRIKYRLLCSATAAPNDYTELGTSSEALGYLGHMDMLNRFFKNDKNTSDTKGRWKGFGAPRQFEGPMWRFKGHAEEPFWKWVCSWARAVRKPSDLGFDDGPFTLPPLRTGEHIVQVAKRRAGMLFDLPAISMIEQREERRISITERCEKVAELTSEDQALVWCHLNPEGDLLEKWIPGAVQVSGDDADELKEEKFIDFAAGRARVLVTKPRIGAWGLNFQNCAHVTFFPSHSFEQFYQGVRRCWRYGQHRPVTVDIVTTPGERGVLDNLNRKQADADRMFANLVSRMNDQLKIEKRSTFVRQEEIPSWLSTTRKSQRNTRSTTAIAAK